MRKWLIALALVLAMVSPSFAALSVDNLVVETEYSYGKKDIEDINILNVGFGGFGASLTEVTSNVRLWQFLVNVGYKINDGLIPYAILGTGYLNFDQELKVNIPGHSIPILLSEFRDSAALVMGAGARGDLYKFENGVTIGYDTRWITFNAESDAEPMQVLPGYTDISLDNETDISYGEFTIDLGVSKFFDLQKKEKLEDGTERITKPLAIVGITPYLGGRYSHVDLNYKNDISIFGGDVKIGTESETQAGMISGILGVDIKVNDRLNVRAGGVLGQESGCVVSVGWQF